MKIECPKCGGKGRIDDAKIPEEGAMLRCPRCQERFPVNKHQSFVGDSLSFEAEEKPGTIRTAPVEKAFSADSASAGAVTFNETCSICRSSFPQMEMIRFGDAWVCAGCKPAYMQVLKQGLQKPSEMRYGGFWIRFGAKFLDALISGVLAFLLLFPLHFFWIPFTTQEKIALEVCGFIIQIIIPASYVVFFIGKYRATPGKMACGLVVVTSEGGKVSYLRALGRYFSELLSGMILAIGYIMAAFDQEKRAMHDRICDTRVVYK